MAEDAGRMFGTGYYRLTGHGCNRNITDMSHIDIDDWPLMYMFGLSSVDVDKWHQEFLKAVKFIALEHHTNTGVSTIIHDLGLEFQGAIMIDSSPEEAQQTPCMKKYNVMNSAAIG